MIGLHLTHLPPGQNGYHSADDNFKWIFLNENDISSIQILLKFVPRGSNDNKSVSISSGNGLAPNRRQAIT